jgi:hypothetical protein
VVEYVPLTRSFAQLSEVEECGDRDALRSVRVDTRAWLRAQQLLTTHRGVERRTQVALKILSDRELVFEMSLPLGIVERGAVSTRALELGETPRRAARKKPETAHQGAGSVRSHVPSRIRELVCLVEAEQCVVHSARQVVDLDTAPCGSQKLCARRMQSLAMPRRAAQPRRQKLPRDRQREREARFRR